LIKPDTYSFQTALDGLDYTRMAMDRTGIPSRIRWERVSHESSDTEVLLCNEPGWLTITPRASGSLRDWLQDAKMRKRKIQLNGITVKVHRGFLEGILPKDNPLSGVYWKVEEAAQKAVSEGKTVRIFGHSLGAAVGSILAYLLLRHSRVPINYVYLYGSPRVGGVLWAVSYDEVLSSRTFNHWNSIDIIPTLFSRRCNYHHIGQTIYMPEDRPAMFNPPFRVVDKDRKKTRRELLGGDEIELISRHGADEYESAIMAERVRHELNLATETA